MRTTSDDDLMALIAKGDKNAFRELFKKHGGHVLGYAKRYLQSLEKAEDVSQEIWLKVVRLSPSYDSRGQFVAWVYTMTRHACLNILRSENRLSSITDDKGGEQEIVDPTSLEENMLTKDNMAKAKEQLDRLPDSQRTALLLYVVEDLSYEEIADQLNTSVSAVKSLIFRARQALGSAA